jgi:chromosome segregation ATPase
MIMTGNYDRLEQPTEEIPSVGVTTRPVIEPVDSLRPSQDDNVTSHSTRLLKAEIERDQYKEEMEELRAQIIRLKIKSSIDSNMVYSQSPDEREHLMREELKAKEREVNDLKQKLASQERESEEALVLSEKRSKSLEEKVKLLEVDNQGLKTQLDVVTADISLKKAEQNQNEKKEAELMSELEKVKEEKETEINRKEARIKHLQKELNKLNNETVPTLRRELEDKEKKQKNLIKENKDLKRETEKNAIQAADRVAVKEREME